MDYTAIDQYILDNPKVGRMRLAAHFDITESQAGARLKKIRYSKNKVAGNGALKGAMSADDFIDKYDVVKKIEEALPKLEGVVIRDADFRTSLGIDPISWARARELPQFDEHHQEVRGKLYWSTPKIFSQLQKKMDII